MVVIICVVFLGTLAARAIFNQQCLRVYELSAKMENKETLEELWEKHFKDQKF